MQTRTWPYGTRKSCEVMDVVRSGNTVGLICHADDDPADEAHVCIFNRKDTPEADTAKPKDRGTLVFTQGGPTGGYWRFVKS